MHSKTLYSIHTVLFGLVMAHQKDMPEHIKHELERALKNILAAASRAYAVEKNTDKDHITPSEKFTTEEYEQYENNMKEQNLSTPYSKVPKKKGGA